MNKKIIGIIVALVLLVVAMPMSLAVLASAKGEAMTQKNNTTMTQKTDYTDVLGVTHAGGYYAFDSSISYIEEGAKRIYDMGSRNIKLWLASGSFDKNYPYNTDMTGLATSNMVDLLKTPYYQNVLKMDFDTYIFEAMEFDAREGAKQVNIVDGMTDEECSTVENLMYDVSKYLMTMYVGSGKSFVLQNWEGDNMVFTNNYTAYEYNGKEYYYETANGKPTAAARDEADKKVRIRLDGMKRWVNARQKGVDRARKDYGNLGVDVRHAFEINFIPVERGETYIHKAWPILLNTVVPFTDCDLYSYSCWSAKTVAEAATMTERLTKYKNAIGDKYTDSNGEKVNRKATEGSRIMVGEFGSQETLGTENGGLAEKLTEETNRLQRLINQVQIEQSLDFGVEYLLYWELYCNELREGVSVDVANGGMAEANEQTKGLYLIRPDGTYNDTYYYLKSLLLPEGTLLINSSAISLDASNSAVLSFVGAAQSVEVGMTISAPNELANNADRRAEFIGNLEIYGSSNNTTFTKIEVEAFVSVQKNNTADLIFVNKEPISADIRFIKVKETAPKAGFGINKVKVYKADNSKLSKLKISGTRTVSGDEITEEASKFTLGSGEFLKINAVMTDASFTGKISFKSSNRYIATVSETGKVQGRMNGTCNITVKAEGGSLQEPIIANIEIGVRVVGDTLLEDGFDGYITAGYYDNEIKNDSNKMPDFGSHDMASGTKQKFYRTDNIQFYTTTNDWLSSDAGDATYAYVLDWNNYNKGSVTYELENNIGGYEVKLINYEGGILDRINVYVSKDDTTYTKINSYITESKSLQKKWNVFSVANRQMIASGMKYIKFEVCYNDVNRWNPQMIALSVYGEAAIPESFVDNIMPTISVKGSYENSYKQGSVLTLLDAEFADNFAILEELEYSRRVFLVLDGAELEQQVADNKVAFSAVGTYIIEYKVIDLGGNDATIRYTISVGEPINERSGLTGGAIAGIACGAAVLVLVIAVAAVVLVKKKKGHKSTHIN